MLRCIHQGLCGLTVGSAVVIRAAVVPATNAIVEAIPLVIKHCVARIDRKLKKLDTKIMH